MATFPTGRWYGSASDVGRLRASNEDAHAELTTPDGGMLLLVCDGMGGHAAGEVASALAVETIGRVFLSDPDGAPPERFRKAFVAADDRIFAESDRPGQENMGTTAVAAFVCGGEAFIAHAGDSRCYHLRCGNVAFRTKDHTRAQEFVDHGVMSEKLAKDHPSANAITCGVGHGLGDGPDIRRSPIKLHPGDALVLCSDGLHDLIEDEELGRVLFDKTAEEAANVLVALANERGGHDNITATVLFYGYERGVQPAASARPATPAWPRRHFAAGLWGLVVIAFIAFYFVFSPSRTMSVVSAPDAGSAEP